VEKGRNADRSSVQLGTPAGWPPAPGGRRSVVQLAAPSSHHRSHRIESELLRATAMASERIRIRLASSREGARPHVRAAAGAAPAYYFPVGHGGPDDRAPAGASDERLLRRFSTAGRIVLGPRA